MNGDDENRFEPKPGAIRSDSPKAGKAKSFLTRAKKLARQHSNRPARGAARAPSGISRNVFSSAGKGAKAAGRRAEGAGVRRGRGVAFVRARGLSGGWRHSAPGMRRVVVKTRYVRQAGQSGKGAAHLRYIQRDGTSRDGAPGRLYSATEDQADGEAFLARGRDDRHQFRFIIAPEDAAELSDLTEHTRDLMRSVEADLGTKLDWVAVNHHNTGHPHVHVLVRGCDDRGETLVINGDYLAHGIRERAIALATLELGPVSEHEQARKLAAEVDQDRFTRIDRAMIAEAEDGLLDLRADSQNARRQFDRTLRLRRLGRLQKMGLATEHAPGVWELTPKLEPTLRAMGERGDIIRSIHRALKADGLTRDPMTFEVHDAAPQVSITGRVVDKFLTDEMGESLTLVVDGIDGRIHHVSGLDADRIEEAKVGNIVEVGPADVAARPADRAIAAMAEDGIYRPSRHLEQARFEGRVPSGDHAGFVDAHVRRLEALRRAGIVERIDADQWRIPEDYERRAAAHDAGRNGQAKVRVLSAMSLSTQIGADGATWLDQRLLRGDWSDITPSGFGQEVRDALDQRRYHHLASGDATRQGQRVLYRRDLLATLRERELTQVGAALAERKGLAFRPAADGARVSGTFTGTVQLASGKFALIEQSQEFTLVPWRPVIDPQLGREVTGVVRGGSISWQLGRGRDLGV
jgi:type IV secretory pathway VirD2 relaxase